MRITNTMMSNSLISNLGSAQEKMDQLQKQMTSGYLINRPSDDPAGIQKAMRLKSNISSAEQWKSNADAAVDYMMTTDGVLGNMTSMLQRIKEIAVQGANGTSATIDKEALAKEVDQISDQLAALANTQVSSKYIFSGTASDQELILDSGVSSKANSNPVNFEVGNSVSVSVSVDGPALYGDTTTGIIASLGALSTALRDTTSTPADASANISATLENIDKNIDTVLTHRSDLGARINRMTAIQSQLETTSANLQETLSGIQDVDLAKAITDFTSQQNVYKAALAVGAKIIQPSLVDYMS